MREHQENPEKEHLSGYKKMEFKGDHYSAGTPSVSDSEPDTRGLTSELDRLEIEMYGQPKQLKKQESLDDLKEMIEAVVKKPLEKIASSVDRAIKLVMLSNEKRANVNVEKKR